MLEAYTTQGYLAALIQRVRLGVLVSGVVYRYPAILVKTVSTLDVLSGGRAYLGLGAAWYEREARGLGVPFPGWSERFELLEEALNRPQPISRPHPPILVGSEGERKTLWLVAKYADACNFNTGIGLDGL